MKEKKPTKDTKKPTKGKEKERKEDKKPSKLGKIINGFMPYLLSVSFVIVLFSQLNLAGGMGVGIKNALNGVFSSLSSYFLPIIIVYHAILWKSDAKRKILLRRIVCSIFVLACFSTLQYLIDYSKYQDLSGYSISKFYELGALAQGGGVVGGFIGRTMLNMGNAVAPLIIVLVVLMFMVLQMFNITPASMIRSLTGKERKEPTTESKPTQKPKPKDNKKPPKKKVEVFDDEDEDDVFEGELGLLDTDEVIFDEEYEEEEEPKKYEDLTTDVTKQRTEKLPSQLKPYIDPTQTTPKTEVKTEPKTEVKTEPKTEVKTEPTIVETVTEPKTVTPPITTVVEETVTEKIKEPQELVVTSTRLTEDGTKTPERVMEIETFEVETTEAEIKTETKLEDTTEEEIIFEPEITEVDSRIEVFEELTEEDTFEEEILDEEFVEDELYDEEITEEEEIKKEEELDFRKYMSEEALKKITPVDKTEPLEVKTETVTYPVEKEEPVKVVKPRVTYKLPPTSLLQSPPVTFDTEAILREQNENARIIVETLNSFNAKAKIVNITRGPTVTRYELMPEPGVRVRSIVALVDDIALNLAAKGIRIESPIPGKSAVGIEVPNKVVSFVYLRDLIEDSQFRSSKGDLTCALGKSISGDNIYADIDNTPHLLVAGATGMGKSVCINSLLVSLLYNSTPDDLRLILIDPKRVELSNYNGIPHLLVPVVCEPKKSLGALQWAVTEMENRFATIEEAGVRNITEFNSKVAKGYNAEKMPRIVIVIDELADLKMAVPDTEGHITRITQKARAAGIHIIIGTQRPSVDVLTGLIKNNIPSRIAFKVPSQVDSRTILDEVGAEKLVSKGDMLVKLVGSLAPLRVQGAYVSVDEIQEVIDYWKDLAPENYDEEVIHQIETNAAKLAKKDKEFDDEGGTDTDGGDEFDPEFYNALEIAVNNGKISSSLLQRKLKLGFQRAARILDQMEECGYIGESNGAKGREVLISPEEFKEIMMRKG